MRIHSGIIQILVGTMMKVRMGLVFINIMEVRWNLMMVKGLGLSLGMK